ncbi:hypothetical protein B0T16DRAFT_112782 [Cercophora newfieldiana]|uniref:DUF7704 domain-containing protein n=1 Tax=Cercophora newfieldiana TaxID=92897 RepID=A0AA39YBQ8_9PEZI|nr:hypothetical protein B0T16DRAFT_112782 [Cercophora newfieldiana]
MGRSALPAIPLFVFGIVEPVLLVMAWITGNRDPFSFFAAQAPNHPLTTADFAPQGLAMTLQIVNVYALLAAVAVACSFTRDAFTARVYLIFVSLADYGHIYATYRAVGDAYFWDVAGWHEMVASNVGVSAALNVVRLLTLVGAFGSIRSTVSESAVAKKRA